MLKDECLICGNNYSLYQNNLVTIHITYKVRCINLGLDIEKIVPLQVLFIVKNSTSL